MRGVSLDATNLAGSPSIQSLRTLTGANGHRLVAVDDIRFYWYVQTLINAGYEIALVLTLDSFSSEQSQYDNAVRWARVMPSNIVWILGNEWNIDGDSSWPTPASQYIGFYNQVASGIRAINPNAALYIGGMFSQPEIVQVLTTLLPNLNPRPNGVDLHLYLDTIGQTEQIFNQIQALNLKMGIGEWNWQDGNKQNFIDYQKLMDRFCTYSFYFCWSDGMVSPLGLVYSNNRHKAVFNYYKDALRLSI